MIKGRSLFRCRHHLFCVILAMVVITPCQAQTTTLGVYAYRDAANVRKQFEPVAQAIQQSLPESDVRLEVLGTQELDKAIATSRIDFVLTNPLHFMAIRHAYRVSGPLATLQKPQGRYMLSTSAGVILTRTASQRATLAELEGGRIGIPDRRCLNGFLAQAYEIKQQGFNPERFAQYQTLGSHDAVMQAVVDGKVDAGFVRTGMIEDWLASGKIRPGQLKIVRARANIFYPLAHSTDRYPEWALAAMPHVPMDRIRRVSNTLLSQNGPLASDNSTVRFAPPQNYLSVETAARALSLPPFEGDSLWQQIQERFGSFLWIPVLLAAALLSAVATLIFFYIKKNRLFHHFNALFCFSPSAKLLVQVSPGGLPVVTEANQAATSLFGFREPAELVGSDIFALFPSHQPDGESSTVKAMRLLKDVGDKPQTFFWEHRSLNGDAVLTHVTLLRLSSDRFVDTLTEQPLYLVAIEDVSQQVRDHQALEDERNALKNILWGTAAGTWEWNIQTGETRFNEQWANMVGYQLQELEPTSIATWQSFCHPEDLERSGQALERHFRGEQDSYDIELRMKHRDGHWIWVRDRGRVVSRTDAGEPLLMAGTHSDITQRKQAETRANDMVSQLRKHAALLPGALYQYCHQPDGRTSFPYASQGIQAIYVVTPEQVKDDASPVYRTIDARDFEYVVDTIRESMKNLTTWRATYRINHPDGHQLWASGIATPERLPDGSVIWHGYLHDVTEEHATQLQLDQYRESLERSNRELEHFAYAASHDLRQPLRMVTSYAQLLERHLAGRLDEDGATMLHYMIEGAQRIDGMLLSLLAYSRVGRKGQPMQRMPLRKSLDEALHFLTPDIEAAQADIQVSGDWPEVMASPDEMTRLLQNLLHNGIKYSKPGQRPAIRVSSELAAEQTFWEIRVCDNGIGIAPDQTGRLFHIFQRLHTRNDYEGHGVGLAICRKIVERHGGEIRVESDGDGKGCCFIFTLPTALPVERDTL